MAQDFYPFVDNGKPEAGDVSQVRHPARIAVYDDAAAAPRVVVVEPKDVREYLEEITLQVTQLSSGQGGTIPFMVIREIVENFIHAYFMEPTISILDHGNTIRFSDQGPGIPEKDRALQYGTTSATEEMRRYIRGVGSGLPYVQQYMRDKGGSLEIDDNIAGGTVVTISTKSQDVVSPAQGAGIGDSAAQASWAGDAGMAAQQGWGAVPLQAGGAWQQGAAYGAPQYGQPPYGSQQYGLPQYGQPVAPQYGTQYMPGGAPPQYAPQAQPMAGAAPQHGVPGAPTPAAGAAGWAAVTVRGRAVLDYLAAHDSVGPSDLARTYGESQPTWTRELQGLEEQGLIRKDGQKRRLTAMGRAFLGQG